MATLQRDEWGIGGSSVTVVAVIGCGITHLRTCKRATGLLRCFKFSCKAVISPLVVPCKDGGLGS